MDTTTERMMMGAAADHAVDQIEWTTPGTYQWTVLPGITSISAVTVQGGQGGGSSGGDGGGLGYLNNIPVTPGEVLTVEVGAGGAGVRSDLGVKGTTGGNSSIKRGSTTLLANNFNGTNSSGGVGGSLTSLTVKNGGGGGGAAGYGGSGGNGASGPSGTATTGNFGGGSGGARSTVNWDLESFILGIHGGMGGGVGLHGQGNPGLPPSNNSNPVVDSADGQSGSYIGVAVGGGGWGGKENASKADGSRTYSNGAAGMSGGVRIIWPGNIRQYPSTRTASE